MPSDFPSYYDSRLDNSVKASAFGPMGGGSGASPSFNSGPSTQAPSSSGRILNHLDRAENFVSDIVNLLSEFDKRIAHISTPQPPSADAAGKVGNPGPPASSLTNRMADHADRLGIIYNFVGSLMGRLEV